MVALLVMTVWLQSLSGVSARIFRASCHWDPSSACAYGDTAIDDDKALKKIRTPFKKTLKKDNNPQESLFLKIGIPIKTALKKDNNPQEGFKKR